MSDKTKGRKVVIFAVPGAFTPTCHSAHVPSFVRTKDQFDAKGVDEIICVSANDPFVMKAWGEATGATAAGITMLGDADASFTKAMGMEFDEMITMFAQEAAIKRPNTVEEIAAMALLLASPEGAGITGAMLSVDGGTAQY